MPFRYGRLSPTTRQEVRIILFLYTSVILIYFRTSVKLYHMKTLTPPAKVPAKRLHHHLSPVPISAVTLADTFWAPRLALNREVTLASQYDHCESTGRVDNFRRVSGRKECQFQGIYFNDSDIYKLLEAMAYTLATTPDDQQVLKMTSALIDEVAAAQDVNGYLNTYFSLERKDQRWTNLRDMHELYCAGHLIEAAVAHFDATGTRSLLDVACRLADHICDTFGPVESGKREGACGHEEIELALISLYRVTGEKRYLVQARYFIDAHGASPTAMYFPSANAPWWDFDRRYHQDHVKFTDLHEVTGHAVRMMYYSCGAADVYAETGDETWRTALEKQWDNMTQRRMYVNGALGARWAGEAFGGDWELPDRAYGETCAAIGSIMWNKRMLQIDGDARYADVIELQLYNAMLPGLSLDGSHYFYQNLLSNDGTHRRQPWFGCACCPPNIARLLASLTGYFYSADADSVWVHLYARGNAQFTMDGGIVELRQETTYPWDGDIALTVDKAPSTLKSMRVRIPAWADGATVEVNGGPSQPAEAGTYFKIERSWTAGDTVRIHLPMSPRYLAADPRVYGSDSRLALARGPIVYCLEQADFDADIDVRDISISPDAAVDVVATPDSLGGVVALETTGRVIDRSAWENTPYPIATSTTYRPETVKVRAIPYYAWANRNPGPMTVWIHSDH